jgi:hypothetical protein
MRTTIQLDGGRRRSNSNSLLTYSYLLLAITPSPNAQQRARSRSYAQGNTAKDTRKAARADERWSTAVSSAEDPR